MNIKLLPEKILESIPPDENLLEESKLEIIYAVRLLKAALSFNDNPSEVRRHTHSKQLFLVEYDIWINEEHYEET